MCIKHIDKKYEYYCEDCKEHLCIVCKGEHVHHKIVILSEYIDDKEFEEIKERLGDRLYSRIVNLSTDIELFGSDKRGI